VYKKEDNNNEFSNVFEIEKLPHRKYSGRECRNMEKKDASLGEERAKNGDFISTILPPSLPPFPLCFFFV
jgi:hypothetical protein